MLYLSRNRPTVCVTCVWAGVDSVWEQEKPEARKMLDAKRAAESHTSGARFVGTLLTLRLFRFLNYAFLSARTAKSTTLLGMFAMPKADFTLSLFTPLTLLV